MSLTKKDLQSIKEIVQETVQESEIRIKEFVRSEFRIQNMVLDTRFRSIDSRFDTIENRMNKGFKQTESFLQLHHKRIAALE